MKGSSSNLYPNAMANDLKKSRSNSGRNFVSNLLTLGLGATEPSSEVDYRGELKISRRSI
jgi:hypothetical protein